MKENNGLFIGLYPGGTLFANKRRKIGGDYQQIALVSPAGNIRFYVDRDKIHPEALERIKATAEESAKTTRAQLEKELNARNDWQREYSRGRILETLSRYTSGAAWDAFWSDYGAARDQDEKNAAIIAHYLKNF